MSRSRRHTPVFGHTTAGTDKPFKQAENRRARRRTRIAVESGEEPPHPMEHGNPWASGKDGKSYWSDARPRDMAK